MPAPKGNKNAEKVWYSPISDEPTGNLTVRVPQSQLDELERLLQQTGKNKSEWLREAIALHLQKESSVVGVRAGYHEPPANISPGL